jgi:hypothetical protein
LTLRATQAGGASFQVIDPAQTPNVPLSGKKKQIMTVLGGLIGGGLVTLLFLILFTSGAATAEDRDAYGHLNGSGPPHDTALDAMRSGEAAVAAPAGGASPE